MKQFKLFLIAALCVIEAGAKSSPFVKVDPKQKYIHFHTDKTSTQIALLSPEEMTLDGAPQLYSDVDIHLVAVPMANEAVGTTIYYALDVKGKKIWTLDLETFNPSAPLIEKDFIYLSGMGKVMKVSKKTGQSVWVLKDLYENKKFEFNGAEPIVRKGAAIAFSAKLLVDDETGKLVEVK